MKYFNALIATVAGNENERAEAIKYLKETDPEIWGDD